jgi:prepilin-type N-terminal cleavage/methylation domain-containing protein
MNFAESPRTMLFRAGFTLIEILVTMFISSILGLMIVNGMANQSKVRSDADAKAETHQGLNGALDSLARDIRLAGACLPTQPGFVPLQAVNGTRTDPQGVVQANDSITIRTGAVTGSTTCPQSALTANAAANSTTFSVADISGFAAGSLAFLIGPNSQPNGEFVKITAVTAGGGCAASSPNCGTVTTTGAHVLYPAATSGIYGLEERVYSIDTTNYPTTTNPVPTLVRNINRAASAQPVALGIESMNVRYRLNTACPVGCTGPCTNQGSPVTSSLCDNPGDNGTWLTVTELVMILSARSTIALSTGGIFREQATSSIQPRNLVVFRSG